MNHVHIDLRFKPANKWNRTSVSTISFEGYVGFIQQLSGREGVFNDKTKQWLQLSINHSAGKQTSKE